MNPARSPRTLLAVLATVAFTLAAACGDEEANQKAEFPENPGPVTLSAAQRGLPLEMNRSYAAHRAKYSGLAGQATAVFVYEQIHSEYVDATEAGGGRAELDERIDDIYETLPVGGQCDRLGGCYGAELALYDVQYLVVDLQRRDREWLVDWEGLSRDEPENRTCETPGAPCGSLNFGRDDYPLDVQERLVSALQRAVPDGIVIGSEMNRYYGQNPDDWANFVAFYWAAFDALKAADPNVRVGPGFNWSYLMESNVATFVEEGEAANEVEPFERAYEAIIAPLLTREGGAPSDFVGLSAIPDPALYGGVPGNVPDEHFAGLRIVLPEGTTPIVWFQLGWSVRSAGAAAPADWYARFLELAGGTTIERVAWWGLTNLLPGDCSALTSATIGAPDSICFRGMYSDSGAETALSQAFFSEE